MGEVNVEKKVAIIIPIFNGKEYTIKCLESIYKSSYTNFEIIIVDDGSTDKSAEMIKGKFPKVIVLQGDGDYWWTKSMNVGVEYALGLDIDYVLTLNNDVEIGENFIKDHVNCAENNPKSIIGSKVCDINDHKRIINGGGKKNLFLPPAFNFFPYGNTDNEHYSVEREVDAIAGMGTFIPIEVFKKAGFYNDRYFPQYTADIEHTQKAKKFGYKLIFNPKAIIYNNTESTWKFPETITLESIKDLLFHKRSGYLLKANYYLYSHYWPPVLWLIPFSFMYIKCFFGIMLSTCKAGKNILSAIKKL